MWDLSQNDGPTANVLMHIIIYSTVYEKKNYICICIGNVGLYIYIGIRAIVKLLQKKKKRCYKGKARAKLGHFLSLSQENMKTRAKLKSEDTRAKLGYFLSLSQENMKTRAKVRTLARRGRCRS